MAPPACAAAALRASFRALQQLMRSSFGHAHSRTGSYHRDCRCTSARLERSGTADQRQPVVGGGENGASRRVSRVLPRTLQRAAAYAARVLGKRAPIQRGTRVDVLCLRFCERWQPVAPAARWERWRLPTAALTRRVQHETTPRRQHRAAGGRAAWASVTLRRGARAGRATCAPYS